MCFAKENFLPIYAALVLATVLAIALPGAAQDASASAPAEKPAAEQKPQAPLLPEVVAKVGTETITGKEFMADLRYRAKHIEMETGRPAKVDKAFRRATLDALIDSRLIWIQAGNSGIRVNEEDVVEEFEAGKKALGTQEAYDKYLEDLGVNEEQLKKEIRQRLVVEKFVKEKTKDLTIPEDEIQKEYERRKKLGQFMRAQPTTDLANILIYAPTGDPVAKEEAHKKAQAVYERIVAGESFEEVAKQVSDDKYSAKDGGAYLEVLPAQVLPEAAGMIASLKVGEVSKPFASTKGWHIIKVLARNEPGTIPFEKVKDRLKAELLGPQRQEVLKGLVDQIKMIVSVEIYGVDGK